MFLKNQIFRIKAVFVFICVLVSNDRLPTERLLGARDKQEHALRRHNWLLQQQLLWNKRK